jgi:hypothetical protein
MIRLQSNVNVASDEGWRHNLARRSELAGDPAHGVGFQRVERDADLIGAMAGVALEGTLLKPPFAR